MVRDRVLETLRLAASELKSDVSSNSTNPAYEKPPEDPAAVRGSLIQFGELYTFPGKQNRLLRFRVRSFEGLISRILYLIPISSSFTDCPETFRLPVTGLRGHASSQNHVFIFGMWHVVLTAPLPTFARLITRGF